MNEHLDTIGTLVDSNILIDIGSNDQAWAHWSASALDEAAESGPLVINQVIFAEMSTRYRNVEEVNAIFPETEFVRAQLPWDAAFLAGRCFVTYRRRGGSKRSPLPDFFIGAHAAVSGLRLLTRDPRRYRTYFPTVELIAPDDA